MTCTFFRDVGDLNIKGEGITTLDSPVKVTGLPALNIQRFEKGQCVAECFSGNAFFTHRCGFA